MPNKEIRIAWLNVFAALAICLVFMAFPLVNPCELEDSFACTWRADVQGNGLGWSFTNYYGLIFYRP